MGQVAMGQHMLRALTLVGPVLQIGLEKGGHQT